MTEAVTYLRNLVDATEHYIEADTATIRLDRLRGVLAELDRLTRELTEARAERDALRAAAKRARAALGLVMLAKEQPE